MKAATFQEQNAPNVRKAAEATIDPFEALDRMPDGTLEPRTPFPGIEGNAFDAEILYARRAAENNNRHPEISRIETKFGKTITGFLYRTQRGSVALQCDTDGCKSVLQTGISFEALLTLPNLREPCKVTPIPDTTQFAVSDTGKNIGYIVTPDENMCGCQITFNHEYECRHLKAVREYQAANTESFQKKTLSDFPQTKKWLNGEPLGDKLDEMVAKHHPDAICNGGEKAEGVEVTRRSRRHSPVRLSTQDSAMESHGSPAEGFDVASITPRAEPVRSSTAKDKEILTPENIETSRCSICGRVLTNPLSCRLEIGPECRKKIHTHGEKHLEESVLSDELIEASKLWKDEKFQKWIIKGCLTLGASLPAEVVCQKGGNQFWGVKSWPHIYYKDCHGIICVINYDSRKLKYRAIDLKSMQTPLDQMVQRRVDELAENGGKEKEVRTICI